MVQTFVCGLFLSITACGFLIGSEKKATRSYKVDEPLLTLIHTSDDLLHFVGKFVVFKSTKYPEQEQGHIVTQDTRLRAGYVITTPIKSWYVVKILQQKGAVECCLLISSLRETKRAIQMREAMANEKKAIKAAMDDEDALFDSSFERNNNIWLALF